MEPIALAARTLQQFLTGHVWDQDGILARLRRIVEQHLTLSGVEGPVPGTPLPDGDVGVVGIGDKTSVEQKGYKTPGAQRQYCGSLALRLRSGWSRTAS